MHLGIHFDHEVASLRHLFISLLDLLPDPRREGVAEDGVRHVGNPLLRELPDLGRMRIILEGLWVLPDELVQPLDLQRVVLRDLEVPGLVVLEELLVAGDQGLELNG